MKLHRPSKQDVLNWMSRDATTAKELAAKFYLGDASMADCISIILSTLYAENLIMRRLAHRPHSRPAYEYYLPPQQYLFTLGGRPYYFTIDEAHEFHEQFHSTIDFL
jgi:hypothetical protein